jgi:hypothetical protein
VELDPSDHRDGIRYDPGFAAAWHRQQQRIIDRQYGEVLAALDLPEGTRARLKELLVARREAIADAADAAGRFGIEGPQAKMAVKLSTDGISDEIRQLAGSESANTQIELAPAISDFKSVLEGAVAPDLASRGFPLTPEQMFALSKGYIEGTYAVVTAGPAQPQVPDPETGLTPQYQELLLQASAYLGPEQIAGVRDFLAAQVRAVRSDAPSSEGAGD